MVMKKLAIKMRRIFMYLNTCSVTENADKEAQKLIRKARKLNPLAKIAVIGCYAQLQKHMQLIKGVKYLLISQA
tara:strand:- start:1881 stop:2102 length:222 start_codon:yes stop_codon:yes gene_type:complete